MALPANITVNDTLDAWRIALNSINAVVAQNETGLANEVSSRSANDLTMQAQIDLLVSPTAGSMNYFEDVVDPTTPLQKTLWRNTTTNKVWFYTGVAWNQFTSIEEMTALLALKANAVDVYTKVQSDNIVSSAVATETSRATAAETTLQTNIDAKAPLASPTFTGSPRSGTAPIGNNTTRIATTAFVTSAVASETTRATAAETTLQNNINAKENANANIQQHIAQTAANPHGTTATLVPNTPAGGITSNNVQGALNGLDSSKAPKASPTFTGNPIAPTQVTGNNTTRIATTAFVTSAVATEATRATAAETTLQTNINAATTPAAVLAAIKTVDGAGSGLDADTLDGANLSASALANTVVKRDGNGFIKAVYLHSSNGLENTAAQSYLYDTGDGYLRKKSIANVKAELGIGANLTLASSAEAVAGVENTKAMTALRVKESIDANGTPIISASSNRVSTTIGSITPVVALTVAASYLSQATGTARLHVTALASYLSTNRVMTIRVYVNGVWVNTITVPSGTPFGTLFSVDFTVSKLDLVQFYTNTTTSNLGNTLGSMYIGATPSVAFVQI